MVFQNKLRAACKNAEAAIAKRAKIIGALNAEARKLSGIAERLVRAEFAYSDAAAELAMEGSTGKPSTSEIAGIRTEIRHSGSVLNGLRALARVLVPELAAASATIATELDGHYQSLENDFTAEWNKAAAAFSLVIGKRFAIERITGRKMTLSDPAGAVSDPKALVESARPSELLEILTSHLEMSRERVSPPAPGPHQFLADQAYVMERAQNDGQGLELKTGDYVMAEMLAPGLLELLASIGYARLAQDPRINEAGNAARLAVIAGEQTERERVMREGAKGLPEIKSESPCDADHPQRRAPELPGGRIGGREDVGSPRPWSEIVNSGRTV